MGDDLCVPTGKGYWQWLNNHHLSSLSRLPLLWCREIESALRDGFAVLSPCIVCVSCVPQGGRFPLPQGWKQVNSSLIKACWNITLLAVFKRSCVMHCTVLCLTRFWVPLMYLIFRTNWGIGWKCGKAPQKQLGASSL